MALVPFCAFAVDGVVLINQSTVTAAGGFPYTISMAGSYKLSGNLAVSDHQAILVAASDVVLDLNGFTVTCTLQQPISNFRCVGDTPLGGAISNVSVRNGVVAVSAAVAESASIVSFSNSSNVIVEDLHVKENSPAVSGFVGLVAGVGSIARHHIIQPNGSFNGALNVSCPSLIEGNITGGIFTFSSGCVVVNNVGTVTAF